VEYGRSGFDSNKNVAFSAIDALWHPVTIIFTRRTFQTSSETPSGQIM
jgi:hypothetical protein